MARSLRGFLIVEAGGQRIALPWSSIERIQSSADEFTWTGVGPKPDIVPLASLFGTPEAGESAPPRAGEPQRGANGPVAVLRCGGGTGAIGFDRIVWRENARLTPLPPRLYPVEEVLGGIVGTDNQVTLVLHPGAIMRRLKGETACRAVIEEENA
jgi:chemotaxis protein histidine kinase CheA